MVRFLIIGAVIAVAFTLYALVDAAMSDPSRARGLPKPVWVVLVVVLPVIGGLLWFFFGRGPVGGSPVPSRAPDGDPRFTGNQLSRRQLDRHMADLEERLRELDDETFPGEDEKEPRGSDDGSGGGGSGTGGSSGGGANGGSTGGGTAS